MAKKLAKKQDGGPQQPSSKPTTSAELASKNYKPRPNSNRMRPDSTIKADPSKFDPSKVSKNGAILQKFEKMSDKNYKPAHSMLYKKKMGGTTKKK